MRMTGVCAAVALAGAFAWSGAAGGAPQSDVLPAPGFHHLHLNSMNPDAAIAFCAKEFPTTSKSTWKVRAARRSSWSKSSK
jgi:hypothetical protein